MSGVGINTGCEWGRDQHWMWLRVGIDVADGSGNVMWMWMWLKWEGTDHGCG